MVSRRQATAGLISAERKEPGNQPRVLLVQFSQGTGHGGA
jgi:hypothetical protein